jgi:hypothetical protein
MASITNVMPGGAIDKSVLLSPAEVTVEYPRFSSIHQRLSTDTAVS